MHDLLWWWCRRLRLYLMHVKFEADWCLQPLLGETGVCSMHRLGLSLCVVTAAPPLNVWALVVFVQVVYTFLKAN